MGTAIPRHASVSIGLPVYNGEAYLHEGLESILSQTFGDFELLVSDNGSTDATPEIVQSLERLDKRIRYIRGRENRGIMWNFDRVFRLAEASTFMWVSADDLLAPTHLSDCRKALLGHPGAILSLSSVAHINSDGALARVTEARTVDEPRPGSRVRRIMRGHMWWMVGLGALIWTDRLRNRGGYPRHVEGDATLSACLAQEGPWVATGSATYLLRQHERRTSEGKHASRADWVRRHDPTYTKRRAFPHWRQQREMYAALLASEMRASDRLASVISALDAWTIRQRRHELIEDLRGL